MRASDPDLLKAYQLKVWRYKQGEAVSLMVHLGTKLGLYGALADLGPSTSGGLARHRDLDERWVREWLLGQAAAGLITKDGDTFSLEPEAVDVLVDEGALSYAAGTFTAPVTPEALATTTEAFHSGRGVTYDAMGADMAEAVDNQGAPWLRHFLIDNVITVMDGMAECLESGAKVADIGCGGGISTEALAKRFPKSHFVGMDPSAAAVALAERRLGGLDNVSVRQAGGEDLESGESFDLAMTLDCMHDVPFPDRIASGVRRALAPDGAWLIKDMRAFDEWEKAIRNPTLALQYGFSINGCLASATSEPGAAGLGTMGFTVEVATKIAEEAGFGRISILEVPVDTVHRYFDIRI